MRKRIMGMISLGMVFCLALAGCGSAQAKDSGSEETPEVTSAQAGTSAEQEPPEVTQGQETPEVECGMYAEVGYVEGVKVGGSWNGRDRQ